MITIEIYSVSLDCSCDFVVDEHSEIETVIDDVAQMIGQKERCEFTGDPSKLCLYSKESERILCHKNSLYDYGIKTGDKLYIV
jgi:uncharacterized ubiquitin-like protein YukD